MRTADKRRHIEAKVDPEKRDISRKVCYFLQTDPKYLSFYHEKFVFTVFFEKPNSLQNLTHQIGLFLNVPEKTKYENHVRLYITIA